jgi:RNA polymerase sigma factor (TIGR02999 family)
MSRGADHCLLRTGTPGDRLVACYRGILPAISILGSPALNELVPIIHSELPGLAAACLRRERRDHTLQPTALVHEAYLRLVDQTQMQCENRAQLFAIAANLMHQILVDHARRHLAAKRGGEAADVAQQGALIKAPRSGDT